MNQRIILLLCAIQAMAAIPTTLGWYEVPNTKLQSVCPPNTSEYPFSSNCSNIIDAWGGGMGDLGRNRLIVWGGGHNDYYGNELYSFDLNNLTLTRLNNPSPLDPGHTCVTTLSDGKPNARHTYGGLAYIAHADRMYVFSGIVACTNGGGSNDTWTLNLSDLSWTRMDPTTGAPPTLAIAQSYADYDPVTKNIYEDHVTGFHEYNYDANTYKSINNHDWLATEVNSGVIDPVHRYFIIIGAGKIRAIDISTGASRAVQDWTSQVTGGSGMAALSRPGVAYDSKQDRIVAWGGGNTVYVFNVAAKSCDAVTYPNGPGAAVGAGTYGRFRYFPKLNVFGLVNNANQNAFTLRLTSGTTGTEQLRQVNPRLSVCPNPMRGSAVFSFELLSAQTVELSVFTASGARVATLMKGELTAGKRQTSWKAPETGAGFYFARMKTGGRVSVVKLLALK